MKTISRIDELRQIIRAEKGLVAYFYNDDCPPCILLRPKVEALIAKEFPKMKLVWINSKTTPDIPASWQVFSNPAILVFFDGKEYRRFSKYISMAGLQESIERLYSMAFAD